MFLDRPIMGWGHEVNTIELGLRLGDRPRDTHNTYLWVLTEEGLAGGLPYFAGLALCARAAWRGRRSAYGLIPLSLLSTVLVVSLSLTWQYRKVNWLVLGLALAGEKPFQSRASGRVARSGPSRFSRLPRVSTNRTVPIERSGRTP